MQRRKSYTKQEQVLTLKKWIKDRGMTQNDFVIFLNKKGIAITNQHLSDIFHERRNPGPKFKEVFKEITGATLVDGLIEERPKREEQS